MWFDEGFVRLIQAFHSVKSIDYAEKVVDEIRLGPPTERSPKHVAL